MLSWKTIGKNEFALFDDTNQKVYVRILKEGEYYIIARPSGVKTDFVYLDLNKAKMDSECNHVPIGMSQYKKHYPNIDE